MDFGRIVAELKNLHFDMNILIADKLQMQAQIYYITLVNIQRKPITYMAGKDLNDPKVIAQILYDSIPKESPKAIKKKATNALSIEDPCECLEFDSNQQVIETKGSRERDALLAYCDCIEFK